MNVKKNEKRDRRDKTWKIITGRMSKKKKKNLEWRTRIKTTTIKIKIPKWRMCFEENVKNKEESKKKIIL